MEYQKMKKILKDLQKINSEKVTNENDKEIPKEGHKAPEERQKVIDNLGINIIV